MVHGWKHSGISTGVVRLIRGGGVISARREPSFLPEGRWYVYRNGDGDSGLSEVVYQKGYIQAHSCVHDRELGYGISVSVDMESLYKA